MSDVNVAVPEPVVPVRVAVKVVCVWPPWQPPESPLADLRRGLEEHRDEFPPDQVAEWEAYLDAFEAQVVDGELPPAMAGMAKDVFESLQERLKQHEF